MLLYRSFRSLQIYKVLSMTSAFYDKINILRCSSHNFNTFCHHSVIIEVNYRIFFRLLLISLSSEIMSFNLESYESVVIVKNYILSV